MDPNVLTKYGATQLSDRLNNVIREISVGGRLRINETNRCRPALPDNPEYLIWGSTSDNGFLFLHEQKIPFAQFAAFDNNHKGK